MIYVCLPVYNEDKCLAELLDNTAGYFASRGFEYRIVAVNDGSSDSTLDILSCKAQELPLTIISHERNLGLGVTVKTLLDAVLKLSGGSDTVITMDADNTHPLSAVADMLASIKNGADVVIASRYKSGAEEIGLSFHRKLCSYCASRLLKIFFPHPGLNDYSSGFRAYRADVLKRACLAYGGALAEEKGFSVMAEIAIKLSFVSAKVAEVPLRLAYCNKKGASKMRVAKTILSYFRLIGKLRRIRKSLKNLQPV